MASVSGGWKRLPWAQSRTEMLGWAMHARLSHAGEVISASDAAIQDALPLLHRSILMLVQMIDNSQYTRRVFRCSMSCGESGCR